MHRILKGGLLAGAVAMAVVGAPAVPAMAQYADSGVSFRYFRNQLANYGDWFYSDRWGEVWSPNVDANFQPYTIGHWDYTEEYGWLWSSDEPWADITYHFGRWVNDPYDGWLWIPGYVWAPAWVVWRSGGDYTGWAPMPPTRAFLEGDESDFDLSDSGMYGYDDFYGSGYRGFATSWVFVDNRNFGERNIYRFAIRDRVRIINLVRRTRNVRTYRIVNNRVFNGGIGINAFARARGVPIVPVPAARVIRRPSLVVNVNVGRQIQLRMRQQLPRGTGRPNSAPRLTPDRMQILGTRNAERPQRLRERPPRPDAPANGAPSPVMPPNGGRGGMSPSGPSGAVPPANNPDRNADRPGRRDGRNGPQDQNPPSAVNPPGTQQPPANTMPSRPATPPDTQPTQPSRPDRGRRGENPTPPDAGNGSQPAQPAEPSRPRRARPGQVAPGDSGAIPPDAGNSAQPAQPAEPPRMRRPRPAQPAPGDNGMAPPNENGSAPSPRPARPRPTPPADNSTVAPSPDQSAPQQPPRRRHQNDQQQPPGAPQ